MKLYLVFMILVTSINCFAASEEADYKWTPVKKGTGLSGIHVTGRVVPKEGGRIVESARVQGRITDIIKREGEKVVIGSSLFKVSSADCISLGEEMRVAKDQALKEMLDSTIRREKQLGLKLVDEECEIVATHAGVMVKRNLELGQTFNVGDPLATIIDVSKLAIELDVPENESAMLKIGQTVSFQLSKKGSVRYSAPIQQIVPAIDQASRTVKIRLSPAKMPLGANVDALVFGDVQTKLGSEILSVPTEALVFSHNKQYVIKKMGKGFQPVSIRVISESEDSSSFSPDEPGQLTAGDLVATQGALFLFNQLQLEPQP